MRESSILLFQKQNSYLYRNDFEHKNIKNNLSIPTKVGIQLNIIPIRQRDPSIQDFQIR